MYSILGGEEDIWLNISLMRRGIIPAVDSSEEDEEEEEEEVLPIMV